MNRTLSLILIVLVYNTAEARTCSGFLSGQTGYSKNSVIEEIGKELKPALNSLVFLGGLIGSPPKRKNVQDSNRSHFGEFAGYRPLLKKLMKEVVITNFDTDSFQNLNFTKQQEAVKILIQILAEKPGISTLEDPFFIHYLDLWAQKLLRHQNSSKRWKFIEAKRTTLRDPEKLYLLFGEVLVQFFQKTDSYWKSASEVLDYIWLNRVFLDHKGASNLQKDLSLLQSLNPVSSGYTTEFKSFLQTSGIAVFQSLMLSKRALDLQIRLNRLVKSDELNVEYGIC